MDNETAVKMLQGKSTQEVARTVLDYILPSRRKDVTFMRQLVLAKHNKPSDFKDSFIVCFRTDFKYWKEGVGYVWLGYDGEEKQSPVYYKTITDFNQLHENERLHLLLRL